MNLDRRAADIFSAHHGLADTPMLVAVGVSQSAITRRCHSGVWERVGPKIYRLNGTPETDRQNLLTQVWLHRGQGQAAAWGMSAAALHGLPNASILPASVVVEDERRIRGDTRGLRRSSSLLEHHLTVVDKIPCTTVARTLFDIAATVRFQNDAERMLDAALARQLVTFQQCEQVLTDLAQSGRNGVSRFRAMLDDRGEGLAVAESELESMFEDLLRKYGIPLPDRQINIRTDRWIGRVDYRLPNGTPIEIDSRRHHSELVDRDRDRARDNELIAAGAIPPLRITHREIRDHPERVARWVRTAAARFAATG